MKWISTLVLIALMNIAIFGVAVFQHGSSHDMNATKNDCVAATVTNTKCPDAKDSLGMVVHHISGLQTFSQGILSTGLTPLLAALILMLSAVLAFVFVKIADLLRNLLTRYQRYRFPRDYLPPGQYKLIRWLSLFENSPSWI
jgi:hypothetical protein